MRIPDHITIGHEGILVRGMNGVILKFLENASYLTAEYIWLRHLPEHERADAVFTNHYVAIRFFGWCLKQHIGNDTTNKELIVYCLKGLSQTDDYSTGTDHDRQLVVAIEKLGAPIH